MNDCCTPEASGNVRSYTFLDVNGIPYIHGEYMDRTQIRQIDRSMVRSEITIQKDDQCRVVVNCSVNDIGLRGSDGMPDVLGNMTKQRKLFQMIKTNYERLDHTMDVVRGGIMLTVEYQLEDATTGYVVSSFQQDFVIPNREYYLDINPKDVNDNAIISHFADTMVATVNEFAHGHRRLLMRITSVNMSYIMLTRDAKTQMHPGVVLQPSVQPLPTCYGTEFDYYYHDKMQNNHMMDVHGCGCNPGSSIQPPTWMNFNRFYHFDDNGRILVLHHDEIHDPRCQTMRIPCGRVTMNRLFEVRPGTRIVFRFSIWKNDITVMGDTSEIAKALQAPTADWNCTGNQFCGDIAPDNETIIRLLKDTVNANCQQNRVINNLAAQVEHLQHQLEHVTGNGCCNNQDCTCHDPKPMGSTIVGDQSFETAQEAINAIQDGTVTGDLTLMADICENLVITGKVNINLNGYTIRAPKNIIEGVYSHTIMVDGGDLTVSGDGEVINENAGSFCVINLGMNGYKAPDDYVVNGIGQGVITLNSGRYIHTKSELAGESSAVIANYGAAVTVCPGVELITEEDSGNVISNKSYMYIYGGRVTGGTFTIENRNDGKVFINDGEFVMGAASTTDSNYVIYNGEDAYVQISGGKFYGKVTDNAPGDGKIGIRIAGGTFNTDISAYLYEGFQQKVTGEVVKA